MTGFGTMRMVDGTVYEGNFKDGKFEGEGTLKNPDGKEVNGIFRSGIILN